MPDLPREQIAHGLAIVYLTNKYGVQVTGDFSIYSSRNSDGVVHDVTGSGEVKTKHLPDMDPEYERVETGERHLWGRGPKKMAAVPTGAFQTDDLFESMIDDYSGAYTRFLQLLERR